MRPDFALRYSSGKTVQEAADRDNAVLSPRLGDRLHVRVFRHGEADAAVDELVQGFVYQDVTVYVTAFVQAAIAEDCSLGPQLKLAKGCTC